MIDSTTPSACCEGGTCKTVHTSDGTNYYECSVCKKPCDSKAPKCDCCGWDDAGYKCEPTCASLAPLPLGKEEVEKVLSELEIFYDEHAGRCDACHSVEDGAFCKYHARLFNLPRDLFSKLEACEAQNAKMRKVLEECRRELPRIDCPKSCRSEIEKIAPYWVCDCGKEAIIRHCNEALSSLPTL